MGSSWLLAWGVGLAVLSGVMNGTFRLPMRFLGRWSWENVLGVFVVVCMPMQAAIAFASVSHLAGVLATTSAQSVVSALVSGFAWGFGAIMFGQGVSAIGIAMGNSLVLAISASLGSFLVPLNLLQTDGIVGPKLCAPLFPYNRAAMLCGAAWRRVGMLFARLHATHPACTRLHNTPQGGHVVLGTELIPLNL